MTSKALIAASLKPYILSILADGDSYGYAIIQRVKDLTDGEMRWTTSTLYPVLHSLENQGFLQSYWQTVEAAPRRKYYQLTTKGEKALMAERQQWLTVHRGLVQLWGPDVALG